jgi:hypothetical protein
MLSEEIAVRYDSQDKHLATGRVQILIENKTSRQITP